LRQKEFLISCFLLLSVFLSNLSAQDATASLNMLMDSIQVTMGPNFRPWPSDTNTQSEFSIDVHPQDENIILFSANATDWPVTRLYGTGVYWSFDGGTSWEGHDDPPFGHTQTDPASVIGVNGYFYTNFMDTTFVDSTTMDIIYNLGGQGIAASANDGANWTRDVVAPKPLGGACDKNHLTIDKTSNRFLNRLYCGWLDGMKDVAVSYSSDFGASWSEPAYNLTADLPEGLYTGINLQTSTDGDVYAAFAICSNPGDKIEDGIGFSKSTNGGLTWTSEVIYHHVNFGIRGFLKLTRIDVNSFPSMAVDRSGGVNDGTIYICWTQRNAPPAGQDPDIVLIKSTDGGANWTSPIRVNDDPFNNEKDQYFPWITVDQSTGYPMIVFYVNILHSINEMDSNKKYQSILPCGFLRVSASDRLCDSIHRPAPPARRLLYSWLSNTVCNIQKNRLISIP